MGSIKKVGQYEHVDKIDPLPTIERKTISLNFVGDILAARAIELTMRKKGYDYPFAKIVDKLADADITFANLETPLIGTATSGKTTVGGTTVFRGDIDVAYALQRAGIDIVSLANNHTKDQGEKGLLSTIEVLDTAGVYHVGAGKNLEDARKLRVVSVQGVRVGYLAYNDADVVPVSYHAQESQSGTNIMDISKLQEDVLRARSEVDVLIVSMHSGTEYVTSKPNPRQTAFAYAAIDAGVDMVIGHHPHVLQPLEIYKGKYIFYSLGNFIFDQPWPDTKESALMNMKISLIKSPQEFEGKWQIETYAPTITPLIIQDFQPQKTVDVSKNKRILERFTQSTHVFSIAGRNIFIELATTSDARILGLSNRKKMEKDTGFLMQFDAMGKHGIWMKDMLFPIDIYWFDARFNLIDKRLSVSPATYPDVFYSKGDAEYVLETPVGLLPTMSLTRRLTGELTYIHSYDKR
jgi:poly-gamma-glutamate capsule biosynthesis protein CapA/YwtB (metallophosphatase superfamily)/uncharacterized membrane protein (UPF0127 family)